MTNSHILSGLQFTAKMQTKTLAELSGTYTYSNQNQIS
jgi:hypothetical protein